MTNNNDAQVLKIPEFALIAMVGISGSGKSSFARKHFKPTEVLSSDVFRGMISDDENDQTVTGDAFDALYYLARKRLSHMKTTVIDATNVQVSARKQILRLAKEYDVLPACIVLNLPKAVCEQRNAERSDRQFGSHVLRNQSSALRRSIRRLRKEGFRYVYVLDSEAAVEAVTIERQTLWTNRRELRGPFDIIGDIHGCYDELVELLQTLGYRIGDDRRQPTIETPEGRIAVFLGDLVDRGPDSPAVLRLVMKMVQDGQALCVPGNHDVKLVKWLRGRKVKVAHGLETTIAQLEEEPDEFKKEVEKFLDGLVSHLVLDEGGLVVAHAGLRQEYHGRASGRVRSFALYGETTGESDEFGLPVRYQWASEYKSSTNVVYGHTPVPRAEWLNGTINIDTGCVFGGQLSALRYPEKELVAVAAREVYSEPVRPLEEPASNGSSGDRRSSQQEADDLLDAADVIGRTYVSTKYAGKVTIREENAAAALEVMSRFAIDPRWLIYLPPTMSPPSTSLEGSFLEHPEQAFSFYRKAGLDQVICQMKHMGSRALILVCRGPEVAQARFGTLDESWGAIFTRTGRPFFKEALAQEVLQRTARAAAAAGLWEDLETDWLLLDTEIMPWSLKAVELLKSQYASVGAAASASLGEANSALARAQQRGLEIESLVDRFSNKHSAAEGFVAAYRQYCWPYETLTDLSIAPFHLLASEGRVHTEQEHAWHLGTLRKIVLQDPDIFIETEHRIVDLTDPASEKDAIEWWRSITNAGAEGMVVKPPRFLTPGRGKQIQPAIKCRGSEYLRIIYGPDYDALENLKRLRSRKLGRKRSLALRESALGIEALERFVAREPLRRIHACVFGILALESEPVDPRL